MSINPVFVGSIAAWRPLTEADADALAHLVNACRRAEGALDELCSSEEIAHQLQDPGTTLSVDTLGGWSADGRLLAWGAVWCRLAPIHLSRAVLHGDVHPEARRHGIGGALVAWQRARALERLTHELPAGLPGRIDLMGAADDEGRAALAHSVGLEPIRWFHKMTRSMASTVVPAAAPSGLEVVAWTDAWSDAALEARDDAWRDHWGYEPMAPHAWRHQFVDDPAFLRPASRLAVAGGRVVGLVLCNEQATDESGDGRIAWLDLIAVRRGWRRRGVASALMGASLVSLRDLGVRTVALNVDADSPTGALGLYERHGFRVLRTEALYAREVGPVAAPDVAQDSGRFH